MKTLVNVQTQVDKEVKERAAARAEESGFGSLQDVIRFLLISYADGTIFPTVASKRDLEYEHWAAQIKHDYEDIVRRLEQGDPSLEKQTAYSVDELIQKLEAHED